MGEDRAAAGGTVSPSLRPPAASAAALAPGAGARPLAASSGRGPASGDPPRQVASRLLSEPPCGAAAGGAPKEERRREAWLGPAEPLRWPRRAPSPLHRARGFSPPTPRSRLLFLFLLLQILSSPSARGLAMAAYCKRRKSVGPGHPRWLLPSKPGPPAPRRCPLPGLCPIPVACLRRTRRAGCSWLGLALAPLLTGGVGFGVHVSPRIFFFFLTLCTPLRVFRWVRSQNARTHTFAPHYVSLDGSEAKSTHTFCTPPCVHRWVRSKMKNKTKQKPEHQSFLLRCGKQRPGACGGARRLAACCSEVALSCFAPGGGNAARSFPPPPL